MPEPGDRDNGVSIKVALIDYGDRNDDGEPRAYTSTSRLSEFEIGRMGNRDIVDAVFRSHVSEIVRDWRDRWSVDDDGDA